MKKESEVVGISLIRFPRTQKDYEVISRMIRRGKSDEEILTFMKKEWRSEVLSYQSTCFCATCLQQINIDVCHECGQTIPDQREI